MHKSALSISNDKIELQEVLGINLGIRACYSNDKQAQLRQQVLIEQLKEDKNFLSDVLRDFILTSCEGGGQRPVPDAEKTVAMLINAGANPYKDHLDPTYLSPNKMYCHSYSSMTLFDIVGLWCAENRKDTIDFGAKMMIELRKAPKQIESNTPDILLRNIVYHLALIDSIDWTHIRIPQRLKGIVETLMQKGYNGKNISTLFGEVKKGYIADAEGTTYINRTSEFFNRAEKFVLQSMYEKEHYEEHRLLRMLKISFIFSILVLPLIASLILAIMYRNAVKKNTPNHTVTYDAKTKHYSIFNELSRPSSSEDGIRNKDTLALVGQ